MINVPELTNDEQALSYALALAIVAPDDERAQLAADEATLLARGLDESTIERCKEAALRLVEQWERSRS